MTDYVELMGFGPKGWGLLMAQATLMTILVSATAFALGSILGALVAWARIAGNRLPAASGRRLHDGVARGSGPPRHLSAVLRRQPGPDCGGAFPRCQGIRRRELVRAGAIAVGIISGAYQGEIFRGAFHAIARGELEAARSVGMPRLLLFRRIIAPQALRFAIPGLGNVWQLALKESALISVVGLTGAAAPGAGRRRLDAPAVRVLHHRGGALSAAVDFLGHGLPAGGARGDARRAPELGSFGFRLPRPDDEAAARGRAADAQARVLLDRRGRGVRRSCSR
jgi:octopine/nopaline transport system permease protein